MQFVFYKPSVKSIRSADLALAVAKLETGSLSETVALKHKPGIYRS